MRRTLTRTLSVLGILLLLLLICIALIRFYPYSYDLATYPKVTQTQTGVNGDPVNLVFVGSQAQVTQSFQKAGWLIPDPLNPQTTAQITAASLAHKSYPTAPVSNLYLFGRAQDLAFEKPTDDVQNRGHMRLWKTETPIDGQVVWVGQASYDSGIEISNTTHLPTHHIAPTVDLERDAVGSDLEKTGLVTTESVGAFTPPILSARNGGGDYYTSDGNVLIVNYTSALVPIHQQAWVYGLKNGLFLFYNNLLGIPPGLLVVIAAIIAGLVLLRVLSRRRKRRAAPHHRAAPRRRGISRPKRRDHGAEIAGQHGHQRSPEWPRVEREHLLREPACIACGYQGKGLQVHHIKPFHLHPQLELDPRNLITLCEIKGRDHHLLLGHLDEWESYNVHVQDDARHFYKWTAGRIRADPRWQKEVSQRP